MRGTGSIHQRSSPNSSCKHKNDDIFLMTTKQLKLQECISSPFSGQYSQHVCAFNVPNTAAQNTLNTFCLSRGLLKVVEGKHTSLLLVLLHKIKTQEIKPQRPWDLIVQLYAAIALFVTWSSPQDHSSCVLFRFPPALYVLHHQSKVPKFQTANSSSLQGFCLPTIPTLLLLKFNSKIYGDAKGLSLLEIFYLSSFTSKKSKYCRNLWCPNLTITDWLTNLSFCFQNSFVLISQVTIKDSLASNLSPFGQRSMLKNSHPNCNLVQLMVFSQRNWTIKNIWKWNKLLTFQLNVCSMSWEINSGWTSWIQWMD